MQIFVRFECFNVFFFHRRDFKILPYWQFYLFEWVRNIAKLKNTRSVADPGFPWGGGTNPPGGEHTILLNFPKNCMKSKEFGPGRGTSKILLCRSTTGNIWCCVSAPFKSKYNIKHYLLFTIGVKRKRKLQIFQRCSLFLFCENDPIVKNLFFFFL